jgi:hypothetical protein
MYKRRLLKIIKLINHIYVYTHISKFKSESAQGAAYDVEYIRLYDPRLNGRVDLKFQILLDRMKLH